MGSLAATRWAQALGLWGIPDEILALAPEPPWVHPPAMFRDDPEAPSSDTPSFSRARVALGAGGTVIDVGCGGGKSSLPLGSEVVTRVTGVDEQAAMLAQFVEAATARGIPSEVVEGRWPEVSGLCGFQAMR